MKSLLILSVLLGGAGFGFIANQQSKTGQNSNQAKMNVGNKPGDIGTSKDILATARARQHELGVFAGGCFWGVESRFRKTSGVTATAVGYIGGHKDHPTYREVCTHTTGHAEAVLVEFDPKVISYKSLVEKFFTFHDPTQVNRQGPDVGPNYRTHIFTYGKEQEATVQEVINDLNAAGKFSKPIATQITPAPTFWMAEEYHQQYNEKNGFEACPIGG